MYTQGFGEILTDIMTVNPAFRDLPSASAILDTSNYTFQAVTFGKDAEGFNQHAHKVYTTKFANSVETEDGAVTPYKHLIILAGQSNMNGASLEYDPQYAKSVEGVPYWNLETHTFDTIITPGVNTRISRESYQIDPGNQKGLRVVYNTSNNRFGPEISLAEHLKTNAYQDTYIFKFAIDGSHLVDLSGTEVSKFLGANEDQEVVGSQGSKAALDVYNLGSWNPSGTAANNPFSVWSQFKDECSSVLRALDPNKVATVTFIWAQGEQDALHAQTTTNSTASGYSATCSYFIGEVSSLFSSIPIPTNFYPIRSKLNSNFGANSVANMQYFPSGYFSFDNPTRALVYDSTFNNLVIAQLEQLDISLVSTQPKVSAASSPGWYGTFGSDLGRFFTPEIIEQQEAMPSSTYGPLLDFDDLGMEDIGLGALDPFASATSGDIHPGGPVDPLEVYSVEGLSGGVSAYVESVVGIAQGLSLVFKNVNQDWKQIHYEDAALDEIGKRFYESWVTETNVANTSYGPSAYNDQFVVGLNYGDSLESSAYIYSSVYLNYSSTYNSVPSYPNPVDKRLENKSTLTSSISNHYYYDTRNDLGHYLNASVGELKDIWNVVGSFPPSGSDWNYVLLSSLSELDEGGTIAGMTNNTGVIVSGQLVGTFNKDQVMDKNGYLTVSPISGIGSEFNPPNEPLTASGEAFSGGALVYSSTTYNPSNGTTLLAVRLKGGDAISLALFGGLNHLGVWCLDIKSMLADGLTPPYVWDHLDNIRRYKLVSKVSLWDNLMNHIDNGTNGIQAFNNPFNYGGPVYTLKFKFT